MSLSLLLWWKAQNCTIIFKIKTYSWLHIERGNCCRPTSECSDTCCMCCRHNYSLVVLKTSLESLGLVSLLSIENGNVGVANNSELCYLKAIPWPRILRHANQTSRVLGNKHDDACGKSSCFFFFFFFFFFSSFFCFFSACTSVMGGSLAEWLACWTQAQKGPGSAPEPYAR